MRRYYEGYQRLIDRVAQIDPDASVWLLHEAPVIPRSQNRLIGFYPHLDLSACFCWSQTPQGFPYWQAIDRILNPNEYGWEDDDE